MSFQPISKSNSAKQKDSATKKLWKNAAKICYEKKIFMKQNSLCEKKGKKNEK